MSNSNAAVVIEKLKKYGQSLSVAESCTGGGILKALTDISGSSQALWGGVVSYSNEAKITMLHVPASVLKDAGAVSAEVADSMAEGVKKLSGTQWSIAVTGVAGPGGGSKAKPVGTVWIAWCNPIDITENSFFCFDGSREEIRTQAVNAALGGLDARLTTAWESGGLLALR